jgi:hypothetical protein
MHLPSPKSQSNLLFSCTGPYLAAIALLATADWPSSSFARVLSVRVPVGIQMPCGMPVDKLERILPGAFPGPMHCSVDHGLIDGGRRGGSISRSCASLPW